MTLSLKLVVEWQRLPCFPTNNDPGLCASTTYYQENLVLVVVFVLESKGLYYAPIVITSH